MLLHDRPISQIRSSISQPRGYVYNKKSYMRKFKLAQILFLLTGSNDSASISCPATRRNVPVNPTMILIAMNILALMARAAPIEKQKRMRMATRYAFRRPIKLRMGCQRNKDMPMAIWTHALAMWSVSTVVDSSAAICAVAGKMEHRAEELVKTTKQASVRIKHFRQVGKMNCAPSEPCFDSCMFGPGPVRSRQDGEATAHTAFKYPR